MKIKFQKYHIPTHKNILYFHRKWDGGEEWLIGSRSHCDWGPAYNSRGLIQWFLFGRKFAEFDPYEDILR